MNCTGCLLGAYKLAMVNIVLSILATKFRYLPCGSVLESSSLKVTESFIIVITPLFFLCIVGTEYMWEFVTREFMRIVSGVMGH